MRMALKRYKTEVQWSYDTLNTVQNINTFLSQMLLMVCTRLSKLLLCNAQCMYVSYIHIYIDTMYTIAWLLYWFYNHAFESCDVGHIQSLATRALLSKCRIYRTYPRIITYTFLHITRSTFFFHLISKIIDISTDIHNLCYKYGGCWWIDHIYFVFNVYNIEDFQRHTFSIVSFLIHTQLTSLCILHLLTTTKKTNYSAITNFSAKENKTNLKPTFDCV